MGKKMSAILAATLTLCLFTSGCVSKKNAFEVTEKEDYIAFSQNFYTDFPVSVKRVRQTIGDRAEETSTEYNTIKEVFEALKSMKIKKRSNVSMTDNDTSYTFTMQDGKKYVFRFEQNIYVAGNDNRFLIESLKELSSISFEQTKAPEDISFFDIYGPEALKWAAGFYAKTPDTLKVNVNHCEYGQEPQIFTDPAFIEKVFTLISHMKVEGDAGQLADTGTTVTYGFYLNDELQASVTLHGNEIVVGNNLYKVSGANALYNLTEIKINK